MAYKTIRRDGRNITIDTATGKEVGVGQGQLKPTFDALGLSNLNETLPLTLKQMGADIQNLPGDISRHLIYSDKVDEKGRPLTIAQANPQPRKLIPEIESYLAREGKSKPVGTKDQPKFADLRGSKTPGSLEAAVDNAAAVSAFAKAAEFKKANNPPITPATTAPVTTPATGVAKLDPNATEDYKTAFGAGQNKMDDMLKYFGSQNNGENLQKWAKANPALAYKEFKKAGMTGKEPFGYDEVEFGKLKENPAEAAEKLGIKIYDGQVKQTEQQKAAQAFKNTMTEITKGLDLSKYNDLGYNPFQIDPGTLLEKSVDFNVPGLEGTLGNYETADYGELLKKYPNIFNNK